MEALADAVGLWALGLGACVVDVLDGQVELVFVPLGFLCNCYREQKLVRCRELLGMPADPPSACQQPDDYRDHYEAVVGISHKEW